MQVDLDKFNQADQQFSAQQPKQQSGGGIGQWIENVLPQIGSFAAPVIGGLLAPETGGLSMIPAMALAGLGGAAGEAAKEKLQGQKLSATNILGQAAGGVGQEVGGRIIGGVVGGLEGMAANKVGGALDNTAESLASKSIQPTPTQAANFLDKHGATIGQTMLDNGLVGKSADNIAEAIKPIQGQFNDIVENNNVPINPDDFTNAVTSRADKLLTSSHPDDIAAGQKLLQSGVNLEGDIADGKNTLADINKMKQEWDGHVDYSQKALDPQSYTNNKLMADSLREVVQKTADSNNLTGAAGESVKELGQKLNSLYDLQDLAARNQFKGGNALIKLGPTAGAILGEGAGATLGHAGGPIGALIGGVGTSIANSPMAASALSKAASGAGDLLTSDATKAAIAKSAPILGGLISRAQPAMASQPSATPAATPSQTSLGGSDAVGQTPSKLAATPAQTGINADSLKQAELYDLATTGGKNITALESIAKLQGVNTTGQLTTAEQKNHDSISAGLSALDAAEQNLTSAGGSQGPLLGAINTSPIGQFTNPSAYSYEKTKVDTATQLAKAITGGVARAQTVQYFLHSMPSVSDTPDVATQKIAQMRNDVLTYANSLGFSDIVQQYSGQ